MTRVENNKTITKVQIAANPFEQAAKITVDGKRVDFECTYGRNTQGWVDVIFYKIHDYINGIEALSLEFRGLTVDYDDIVDAVQAAAKNLRFSIVTTKHIPVRTADERLAEMKEIISDILNNSAIKEFHSEGFRTDFERILAPGFAIHVLATMSAGKSTLINAMIGKDILPAKNQACTATMTAIHDRKEAGAHFNGKAWDKNGNLVASCEHLRQGDVEKWNHDTRITDIDIWGDINAIKTSRHASPILVDTPGPNNSQNFEHRKATFSNIEKSDMSLVLYVMNATSLAVDDDKALLERICKVIDRGGRAARDRFIFVLNKIDMLNPNKEPVEQILANAKKYLAGLGIKDARIFPVAAETTKLARMEKAGQKLDDYESDYLSNEARKAIKQMESRIFNCVSCSPSVQSSLQKTWNNARAAENTNALAELFGGVPVIEAVIAEHMEKYAYVHKVAKACKTLREHFNDVYQKEVADIESIIGASDEELKALTEDIEKLKAFLDRADFRQTVSEEINKKKDIPDDVEQEIQECRKRAQDIILDLEKEMSGAVSLYDAEKILSAARNKIDGTAADLCNFLESEFDHFQERNLSEYKKIYDDNLFYIFSQVGSKSPVFSNMKMNIRIEQSMLKFDNDIIEKYTQIFTEARGNPRKAWYKPWTWGDDNYTITQNKVVNLNDIYSKEMLPARKRFDENIERAKKRIVELSTRLKRLFEHELMPKAELVIGGYLSRYEDAIRSKDSVERRRCEAESSKQYLEKIKKRIDYTVSL